MEPTLLALLAGAAGLTLGAVGAWLAGRARVRDAVAVARAESEGVRRSLEERLRSREERLAESAGALAARAEEATELRRDLAASESARATAEAQAARLPGLETELAALQAESSALRAGLAALESRVAEERKSAEEKLALLEEARTHLADAFKAMASDALSRNNQAFLDLARENLERMQSEAKGDLSQREQAIAALVKPLGEQLGKVEGHVRELEKARELAYGSISQHLRSVTTSQETLQRETANLVKALRAPQTRGQWGELQLRRAVELAGLVDHCDFDEQVTIWKGDAAQRPDLVVHLPGGKEVVVDAKAPLAAYLDSLEAPDDAARAVALHAHARQVREHVKKLATKSYWDSFATAPDFVVLFLPGEHFLSAALASEPLLFEDAFAQSVLLCSPTNLIALLKSVFYGWQQEALAANARQISQEARVLYDRLRTFSDHLRNIGNSLQLAVGHYNRAVGSFEGRVLVQGRKLEALGIQTQPPLASAEAIELAPRLLTPPESSAKDRDGDDETASG